MTIERTYVDEPHHPYTFSYYHAGAKWSLTILCMSWEDAEERAKLLNLTLDGAALVPGECEIPERFLSHVSEKTLNVTDINGARQAVPDIEVFGNGDMFALLCKASSKSQGWMKSTKAMEVPGGCVVQCSTQQRNADGTYSVAEAVCYVPGVMIVADESTGGRRLEQHCWQV